MNEPIAYFISSGRSEAALQLDHILGTIAVECILPAIRPLTQCADLANTDVRCKPRIVHEELIEQACTVEERV